MNDIYEGTWLNKTLIGHAKNGIVYLVDNVSDKKVAMYKDGEIYVEWLLSKEVIGWYDKEFLYMMRAGQKCRVATVSDGYIRDYESNLPLGEYTGDGFGALAIPFFYDFKNHATNENLSDIEDYTETKQSGFISETIANIISTLLILLLGFICIQFSFSYWGESISNFNFQSLGETDMNNVICLGTLMIGAIIVGFCYMYTQKKSNNTLVDCCGEVYSWMKFLIIPVEIINFVNTNDFVAIIFIPLACMLVLIAPAIIFGSITWIFTKLTRA